MKPPLIPILVFLVVSTVSGRDVKAPQPADPNIRPAGEVVLKFEQKIEIPEIKRFSEDGILEIFPGDVVHLEFQEVEGKLVRPKVVSKVADPQRTMTFKMSQDKSITMLSRTSEIQQTVALDCVHRGLNSGDFSPTNLRPTEKGLGAFDSWPNTIWILRLSNIEVTSKSAAEAYEEKVSKARAAKTSKSEQSGGEQPAPRPESK